MFGSKPPARRGAHRVDEHRVFRKIALHAALVRAGSDRATSGVWTAAPQGLRDSTPCIPSSERLRDPRGRGRARRFVGLGV